MAFIGLYGWRRSSTQLSPQQQQQQQLRVLPANTPLARSWFRGSAEASGGIGARFTTGSTKPTLIFLLLFLFACGTKEEGEHFYMDVEVAPCSSSTLVSEERKRSSLSEALSGRLLQLTPHNLALAFFEEAYSRVNAGRAPLLPPEPTRSCLVALHSPTRSRAALTPSTTRSETHATGSGTLAATVATAICTPSPACTCRANSAVSCLQPVGLATSLM